MTVAKVTASSYDNLGRKGTRQDNEMTAIDGLWLSTPDFEPTIVNLAKSATVLQAIKDGILFPLNGLDSYEVQSSDDTIYEAPSGNRKLLKRGKTRYMFNLDIPLDVHQSLQSYNNGDLKLWIIRDGKVCFYNPPSDPTEAHGFTLNMVNAGRMTEVPADGSTPGFTPLYIDLANYREWDEHGAFIEPSEYEPRDLEPIIDVKLLQLTSPAASTTAITVEVYAEDGFDAAGAAKKVYIKGLLKADFDFFKADGSTAQDSGLWTVAESTAGGTYTITKTTDNLEAGKLSISPTSVTAGIIVKAPQITTFVVNP
jgi:hypothetical protein